MIKLLEAAGIHAVLLDIGAAGGAPAVWKPIASQSVYVGFDPDLRDMTKTVGGEFLRRYVLNKAVTCDAKADQVEFQLTAYPHCSSTLTPDFRSLSNYSFQEYFAPTAKVSVPAVTLNAALKQLEIDRVDWVKLDTQGTDLRIFQSLDENVRSRVLAVDIEPSLMPSYQDEDLFVDAHRWLTQNGFWISGMNVGGAARIRKLTLDTVVPRAALQQIFAHRKLVKSPIWCEARYLRTLESLSTMNATRAEYALLWTFAMVDRQLGFAMDTALEYQKVFGPDTWSGLMIETSQSRLKVPLHHSLIATAKTILPKGLQELLRTIINGSRSSQLR